VGVQAGKCAEIGQRLEVRGQKSMWATLAKFRTLPKFEHKAFWAKIAQNAFLSELYCQTDVLFEKMSNI
jgi:hypothetical protein